MTTVPIRSWRATTAPRWRKCFSTSRAGGWRRARHERDRHASRDIAAPHPCDGAALLVSPDVVLAAAAGTGLLAGAADHHLGFSAELYFADIGVFRAGLRLLSGRGAAGLAAICRLDAAADLRVRGHARAADRSRVSGRSDGGFAGHERRLVRCLICDLSCPFTQRQAPRIAARGWRISHTFPVDSRGFRWFGGVDIPICALTLNYAFGSMLRRKTGV